MCVEKKDLGKESRSDETTRKRNSRSEQQLPSRQEKEEKYDVYTGDAERVQTMAKRGESQVSECVRAAVIREKCPRWETNMK